MKGKKTFASLIFPKGVGFLFPEEHGVLSPDVTGIEQGVQAFRVDVREEGLEVVHHLVVMTHYPEMKRDLCEQLGTRLRVHFSNVIVSFTVSDEPGNAVFFIPSKQRDQHSLLSVASAIVVVMSSCGWDESERIRVICETTGESLEVKYPEYENGQFEIEVCES